MSTYSARFLLTALACGVSMPALAAQAGETTPPENAAAASAAAADASDIIVTARKRNESSIAVPVVLQAFASADLQRYATADLNDLGRQVPGLLIQANWNQTAIVFLRGIGTAPANTTAEQSVSVVVDGVQIGGSGIIRAGQIDVDRVEVLKGPQALFFGKNSPGGVISIQTADPGDHSEVIARGGYEIYAREATAQLTVSTPLSETLGIRAVGYLVASDGYFKNKATVIPGNLGTQGPIDSRTSGKTQQLVRLTALFKPGDTLSFRAKYTFDNAKSEPPLDAAQRYYCPNGSPQVLGFPVADDCSANRTVYVGKFSPSVRQQYPTLFTPENVRYRQHLATLNAKADIAEDIALTSDSGYYNYREATRHTANLSSLALLPGDLKLSREVFSEELRISTSKADWPVNFTGGLYYESGKAYTTAFLVLDQFVTRQQPAPGIAYTGNLAAGEFYPKSQTYSGFLQGSWDILPTLELSGGARYTHQSNRIRIVGANSVEVTNRRHGISYDNLSPELTLSFKPTSDINIFGSYRRGFKAGGFDTASGGSLTADRTFLPEKVKGFEAGVKARMGDLRVNLAAYRYRFSDLQVSAFNVATTTYTVQNAAAARIQGVEADFNWRPSQLRGVSIHGALNYNHGRYLEYVAACYVGQTIAEGCNLNRNATTGAFTGQSLAGRQLVNAPAWTGNLGVDYSGDLSSRLTWGASADGNYSTGYYAHFEQVPEGRLNKFVRMNASLRIGTADRSWELALIGTNLTNIYRAYTIAQVNSTGVAARTGTNLTGGRADLGSLFDPGRQIRMQLTARF